MPPSLAALDPIGDARSGSRSHGGGRPVGSGVAVVNQAAEEGKHDLIDSEVSTLLDGFCDNFWVPLKSVPKACHASADAVVWLLAHAFGFAYASTSFTAPPRKSLCGADVLRRLAFATNLQAPSLPAPHAMGVISLTRTRRSDVHSFAFIVHRGEVMVLQADRDCFSLYDWADEWDDCDLPLYIRAAYSVYGRRNWVSVAQFMTDVTRDDFEALCGERCPRVYRLSLLVHERLLGTKVTRGFGDDFVHGARVHEALPTMCTTKYGQAMMQLMQQLDSSASASGVARTGRCSGGATGAVQPFTYLYP